MDKKKEKRCFYAEHKEIDIINYCAECKKYMYKKCANYHKGFFEYHFYIILIKI